MTGVVNEVPVLNEVPPVAAAYHFTVVPILVVAPRVTVPVPQRIPGDVVNICGSFTTIFH